MCRHTRFGRSVYFCHSARNRRRFSNFRNRSKSGHNENVRDLWAVTSVSESNKNENMRTKPCKTYRNKSFSEWFFELVEFDTFDRRRKCVHTTVKNETNRSSGLLDAIAYVSRPLDILHKHKHHIDVLKLHFDWVSSLCGDNTTV